MFHRPTPKLNPKKRYLQVALNNTLEEAHKIISDLPMSDRIIIEAGTPLIKRYGEQGIRRIRRWCIQHLANQISTQTIKDVFPFRLWSTPDQKETALRTMAAKPENEIFPYIVADLKTMDRGETEVEIAARGGASAAIALGSAPIETLNSFVEQCEARGLDAMIDMLNVKFPLSVLRELKKIPAVVILHRGVDEEQFNKEKRLPLHEIQRIKGNYNILIAVAGQDTIREVQRAIFNGADIVVIWKSVFQETEKTVELVNDFLKQVK